MASLAESLLSWLEGCGPPVWIAGTRYALLMTTARPPWTIRDAGDRVLIHCFAECDPKAVLEAIGLRWQNFTPNPGPVPAKGPTRLPGGV